MPGSWVSSGALVSAPFPALILETKVLAKHRHPKQNFQIQDSESNYHRQTNSHINIVETLFRRHFETCATCDSVGLFATEKGDSG